VEICPTLWNRELDDRGHRKYAKRRETGAKPKDKQNRKDDLAACRRICGKMRRREGVFASEQVQAKFFRKKIEAIVGKLKKAVAAILPVEEAQIGSASRDIERMLGHLSGRQGDIVRCVALEGHSAREAAKRLNMTEGAVRVSLHRALKALAAIYRDSKG